MEEFSHSLRTERTVAPAAQELPSVHWGRGA